MKVSWHMIVKDEEEMIGCCLDSIKGLYDQLVIVDTGSTDKTKEICAKYTSDIYDFEWIDDFAAARNFALEQCEHDIIGWCDADDILDADPLRVRRYVKESFANGSIGINMPYIYGHVDGGYQPSLKYVRMRFFGKDCYRWSGKVHEFPQKQVKGPQRIDKTLEFEWHHHREDKGEGKMNTARNLKILRKVVEEDPNPRYLFYLGKEMIYNGFFKEAIVTFQRYIPISDFHEEKHRAMYEMAYCFYKLKDYYNARVWALKAIETHQDYAQPYLLMGWTYTDVEDWKRARPWFLHATDLPVPTMDFFDYVPSRTYEPLEWLAICEWQLGNYESAREYHSRAKEFAPNHPWLQDNDPWYQEE